MNEQYKRRYLQEQLVRKKLNPTRGTTNLPKPIRISQASYNQPVAFGGT